MKKILLSLSLLAFSAGLLFADGSKSDAASFDFCENPEIEFD